MSKIKDVEESISTPYKCLYNTISKLERIESDLLNCISEIQNHPDYNSISAEDKSALADLLKLDLSTKINNALVALGERVAEE